MPGNIIYGEIAKIQRMLFDDIGYDLIGKLPFFHRLLPSIS
jgi:hypothetical protein